MQMKIAHIIQETPKVKSFILEGSFDFKPGQSMECAASGEKRMFSISTSPTEGALAFTTLMGESPMKSHLSSLQPGDVLDIDGPYGNFILDEAIPRPIFMIAGGIGITPLRSMVKYAIDTELPNSIKLLHSIKTEEDMIFEDDVEQWEETDKFWYIPALTQQSPTDWYGELERIDSKMIERHMDEGSIFYVSGKPDFVDHILNVLGEMGIEQDRIKFEKFTGY